MLTQPIKRSASTFTPLHVYNLRLRKDANLPLSFPAEYNTGLLVVEGSVLVNGENVGTDHFALMKNDGEQFTVEAVEDAIVLVLSGEPINEPIAQYGPFLMNTWEELEQAIKDVNAGKLGILEE